MKNINKINLQKKNSMQHIKNKITMRHFFKMITCIISSDTLILVIAAFPAVRMPDCPLF